MIEPYHIPLQAWSRSH